MLTLEVIVRGSSNFIGFRDICSKALLDAGFVVMLLLVLHLWGDLLEIGWRSARCAASLFYYRISRGPKGSNISTSFIYSNSVHRLGDTKPSPKPDAAPDLRTLALAYFEVSQLYPAFRRKGFALLEQAARELPDDAEVQAAYGMVLMLARPRALSEASQALQKAIDAGSRSVEVRTRLAKLRLRDGKLASAIQLYNEAIETDPYYTPAYLGLAYLYAVAEDRQEAIETLQRILKYDPGNETARTAMTDAKVA